MTPEARIQGLLEANNRLVEERRALTAENERLRKALEEIANETKRYLGYGDFDIIDNCSDPWARDIAREALTPT